MKPHYRILRLNHGRAPTVQYATLKEAETEALRLAGQHPGETFEILKVLGLARTTEPAVFWNDGVEPPAPSGLPVQPELEVAPGEGYRLVELGEYVEAGDEWFANDRWLETHPSATGVPRALGQLPLRRKLPETRYPTTPLPEGFDRWECRGLGWDGSERAWFTTGYIGRHPNWDVKAYPGPTNRVSTLEYWEAVKDQPAYRMLEPDEVIEEGDEWQSAKGGWTRAKHSVGALVATHARHRIRRPINKKQAP